MSLWTRRALASVKLTASKSRSGAQKRRRRGLLGGVARCERIVGVDGRGDPRLCGRALEARHGHARCPIHGAR